MTSFSTKPVRVAVIGAGYLGKFHAAKYAALPNVELVAVADINQVAADQVAANVKTAACSDYTTLFGQVDAVSIVTPTESHYAIAADCLHHDLDVLIEKPMTRTLAEADDLIELAKDRGRMVQVGFLERFNPAMLAAQGHINRPRLIDARRTCIYKPRGTDVSVVLDMMIHDLDLALALAKAPLTGLQAGGLRLRSDSLDVAYTHLTFANGCVAQIHASRVATENARRLNVYQDDGYFIIDCAQRRASRITTSHTDGASALDVGPGLVLTHLESPSGDALEQELMAFIQAVRSRQPPPVTGLDGRQALAAALTIMEQIGDNG